VSFSFRRCFSIPNQAEISTEEEGMPKLFALSVGPHICLASGDVLVGRDPKCDVRLPSPRVSRRHCIINTKHGVPVVCDLGSANGTWVNGNRVWCARLSPGDEVAIADVRYQLGVDERHGAAVANC
jgi:pSer/pThr/pTyr-binding forkhead associated (FHA) protein